MRNDSKVPLGSVSLRLASNANHPAVQKDISVIKDPSQSRADDCSLYDSSWKGMKIYANLLVLCASFSTAAAFVVQGPKTLRPSFALRATPVGEQTSWTLPSIAGPSGIVRCEGLTRRTFDFPDISQEVVQVGVNSEGRPMKAEIELWIGPDWTPYKLKAFSEDGRQFPFQALVGTRNKAAQLEVRNVGEMELPFRAACSYAPPPLAEARAKIPETSESRLVQGGAIYSAELDPDMDQVRVFLNTDTRQLNARVELLNGPNNIKQSMEVFTNNGVLNSLYVVFNTPSGAGNTIRIINQAPLEFPAYAFIAPV
jgi:hypothetical protein